MQGVYIYLTLRNFKLGPPVLISQDLSPRNALANYPGVEPLFCAYKSENLQSLSPSSVSLAPEILHLQSWHRIIWETVNQLKKYSRFSRDCKVLMTKWGRRGVVTLDNLLTKEILLAK